MKKVLVIAGVALMALSPVIAQQTVVKDAPQKSRTHERKSGAKLSPEQRVDARVQRLDKTVDLSQEQKTSIKAIYLEDAERRVSARNETQQQVEAVLTPEQKAKSSEQTAKRKEAIKVRQSERGELKRAPGIKPAVSAE